MMYRIIFSVFTIFIFCACEKSDILDVVYKEPDPSVWVLNWEDNFNVLDTTNWSKCPRSRPDWAKYMTSQDICYDIIDNNLVLKGLLNTVNQNDTATFLVGGVWTRFKKSFSKGRIEVRAKFTSNQGAWPAIWLFGDSIHWGNSKNSEIDIMEHLNYDDIIYQTVHSPFTGTHYNSDKSSFTSKFNTSVFNVFGVEIYDDKIVFLLNGCETAIYHRNDGDPTNWYFDTTFHLILSMQLEGRWVGAVDKTSLPASMYIDWVRYYKKR